MHWMSVRPSVYRPMRHEKSEYNTQYGFIFISNLLSISSIVFLFRKSGKTYGHQWHIYTMGIVIASVTV